MQSIWCIVDSNVQCVICNMTWPCSVVIVINILQLVELLWQPCPSPLLLFWPSACWDTERRKLIHWVSHTGTKYNTVAVCWNGAPQFWLACNLIFCEHPCYIKELKFSLFSRRIPCPCSCIHAETVTKIVNLIYSKKKCSNLWCLHICVLWGK
jgi:hypothetical protein